MVVVLGDTKIGHFRVLVRRQQHICGLDVSMHVAALMQKRDAARSLPQDADAQREVDCAVAVLGLAELEEAVQRAAVEKFQDDAELVPKLECAKEGADARAASRVAAMRRDRVGMRCGWTRVSHSSVSECGARGGESSDTA